MTVFEDFLVSIENEENRARMEYIFSWIAKTFPNLEPVVKWNQPMFTDHGLML